MRRYLLPRLRDLLFMVVLAGALLVGSRMLNTDGDLGRHLTLGRYILEQHQIPTRDLLSFTKPGQPRPAYEWLAQVSFALADRWLGLDGVILLTASTIAVSFLLVYLDSTERSSYPVLALVVAAVAAVASSLHWLPRPHVFSFLLFAIWVRWLDKVRTGKQMSLWKFPALMLIWANTHGGFVIGLLAWCAYLAGWLWGSLRKSADWAIGRNLLIVGATSLAASILTPDFWRNWGAILNNRSAYILSRTIETMPPQFSTPGVWPFAVLAASSLLFAIVHRKQVAASHCLLLAGLALMSLSMARNIPFFAIATAPILTDWLGQSFGQLSRWTRLEENFGKIDSHLRGFAWTGAMILAAIGFFAYRFSNTGASFYQFGPQAFPVQAADWIEGHPLRGNMFNDFNWGGYLLYRLWPNQRVFVDSQSDFYGEELTRQYADILGGNGDWEAQLSRYDVDWIIVPPKASLAEKARTSQDWQIDYEDTMAVIFVRK